MRHPSLDERFDPAVRIVDSDPAWPMTAAAEMARIETALGGLATRTDHVGSSAAPGLAAKPTVDLHVSVVEIRPTDPYARPLEELGYLLPRTPARDRLAYVRGQVRVCSCAGAAGARLVEWLT